MTSTPGAAIVLTRQQLYERVWDTPMRKLGPELGGTDVGLKKICGRYGVPTPGLGYWAKLQYGKAPKRPRLPKLDDPRLAEIKILPCGGAVQGPRPEGPQDPLAERERDPGNKIEVAAGLEDLLPAVARTHKSLLAAKPDEYGMVEPRAQKTMDVRVAPERVERACRIMQALLTALDRRGLVVAVGGGSGGTTVEVSDEQLAFGIYEVVRRQERPPIPAEKRELERWYGSSNKQFFEYVPTGILSLAVFSGPSNGRRRRFTDSKRRPVESLLNAFVISLYRTAEDIKADRARKEQLRLEREEAERQRHALEWLRVQKLHEIKDEEKRVAGLMAEANGWHDARRVRRYVEATRAFLVKRDGSIDPGSDADEWVRWASDQADRLDPLVENPPSILDERARWERSRH